MPISPLLHAIKSKNWHAANEEFKRVMRHKLDVRLKAERQAAFNEAAKPCPGYEYKPQYGVDTCANCGNKALGYQCDSCADRDEGGGY
jgi:hypothetical protein